MRPDKVIVANQYRDRPDCENGFDEMKNQWGISGFTTQDINRCQNRHAPVRQMRQLVELVLPGGPPGRTHGGHHVQATAVGGSG